VSLIYIWNLCEIKPICKFCANVD